MTSREIYKRFKLKVNGNDTNEGVDVLSSLFVLLFNDERSRWLGQKLKENGDNIKLDNLSNLLETDVELKKVNVLDDSVEFEFPENFYRYSSSYSIVDKGNCKGAVIYNFEKKALGLTAISADYANKPSFDLAETPVILTKRRLKVFFEDFVVQKCIANFYKLPGPIDIAGYKRPDGSMSSEINNTDLTDENIDEILDRMAKSFLGNNGDTASAALKEERITKEP